MNKHRSCSSSPHQRVFNGGWCKSIRLHSRGTHALTQTTPVLVRQQSPPLFLPTTSASIVHFARQRSLAGGHFVRAVRWVTRRPGGLTSFRSGRISWVCDVSLSSEGRWAQAAREPCAVRESRDYTSSDLGETEKKKVARVRSCLNGAALAILHGWIGNL